MGSLLPPLTPHNDIIFGPSCFEVLHEPTVFSSEGIFLTYLGIGYTIHCYIPFCFFGFLFILRRSLRSLLEFLPVSCEDPKMNCVLFYLTLLLSTATARPLFTKLFSSSFASCCFFLIQLSQIVHAFLNRSHCLPCELLSFIILFHIICC